MMVYVALNTMIWLVVYLTQGRVTPSNWHEKEVYNWGMGKRDMPTWMRILGSKMTRKQASDIGRKDAVELVDTDSTARNSSQNCSAEDKDDVALESHNHHLQNSAHDNVYSQ
jgi:AGZA family xanthine/uracil permease-like MFS transporter